MVKNTANDKIELTDEEVVKAIAFQCGRGIPYIDGTTPKSVKFDSVLDLIHRLQYDYSNLKERYVKVLDLNEKVIAEQKAEIERLKINLANEKKWGKIQAKQAEKYTAKKIWGDCIDKIMRGCGDDKEFWVMKILIETFKKYEVGF